jgi:hypothetical protein
MKALARVRELLAGPERAERRRQRKIRSGMIGSKVARGDGGYQSDNAFRGNQGGAG